MTAAPRDVPCLPLLLIRLAVMDIFPVGSHSGGPPFAMSEALVRGLLQPLGFVNTLLEPPAELARSKTSAGELISRWSKPM